MQTFIPGLKLSELFYDEVIRDILKSEYPDLRYSAGLIDFGSEVLGFDTQQSTDHHWGPRVQIFLDENDIKQTDRIADTFCRKLPLSFRGHSTHFSDPDEMGVKLLVDAEDGQKINHRVEIRTIQSFFKDYLNINPFIEISILDWITISEQKLCTIKNGKIFHDDLCLQDIRENLNYYPRDVMLYLMASEWKKIGQEEPFVGRCGDVGDELGSQIIAARLVQSIMRLCFLMEKEFTPYSKWFGSAFKKLGCSEHFSPILSSIMSSENWQAREKYLSQAYERLTEMHNNLKITKPLKTTVSQFHDRPYKVIHGDNFASEIRRKIEDDIIRNIPVDIGSPNQFSDSVDLLDDNRLLERLKLLYQSSVIPE